MLNWLANLNNQPVINDFQGKDNRVLLFVFLYNVMVIIKQNWCNRDHAANFPRAVTDKPAKYSLRILVANLVYYI